MEAKATRINWSAVIEHAATIVESYSTGVTLRQLFYRLVSAKLIPNRQSSYSRLSSLTAKARRDGWFPDLIDNTRVIRRPPWWDGADEAMDAITEQYRRDRTEHQSYSIYVAVEKNALATLIASWFEEHGLPVLAFGGYPSQTFVTNIIKDVERRSRPAVLLYGGDFDATGVDILRDFLVRTQGVWDETHRIALNEEQIAEYDLPPLPGKHWDPRAAAFEEKYGELVQVELDALPPDVLKKIYEDAVNTYWEPDEFDRSLNQEAYDRKQLLMPDKIKEMVDFIKSVDSSEDGEIDFDLSSGLVDRYDKIFDEFDKDYDYRNDE